MNSTSGGHTPSIYPYAAWFRALFTGLGFLVPTDALHAQDTKTYTVTWQSSNATVKELPAQFATLYTTLASLQSEGYRIPTKKIDVNAGSTIEDALRENKLFSGKDLPRQTDLFTCKLNAPVCTIRVGASGNAMAADSTAEWKLQPNASIVVPDLAVEPTIVHRTYDKAAADTLKNIVVRDREGCASFDERCELYVKNLNKRLDVPIEDFKGKIVVPTKAFRTTITLEAPPGGTQVRGGLTSMGPTTSSNVPAFLGTAAEADANSARQPATSEKARFLRQVVPTSRATMNSGDAAAQAEGNRKAIFKLISYPARPDGTFVVQATGHTNVAVLDLRVDGSHCMFKNVQVLDMAVATAGAAAGLPPAAPPCGSRAAAVKSRDHGTHVVGLIGSSVDAEVGPGVNPRARIAALTINPDDFQKQGYLAETSDRLNRLYSTDFSPDVVNLSFAYDLNGPGQNDTFSDAIASQVDNTLFVVAAGNDGFTMNKGSTCSLRPACLASRNVISVGALTLAEKPELLKSGSTGSNFGTAVHIAAPAENIVSTISGNKMGLLSGTSQAAPLVTGIASIMYMVDRRLLPGQVKNRLMYTADLFPHLYEKVFSGRLNASRALKNKHAQVATTDGDLGDLRLAGNDQRTSFTGIHGEKLTMRFGQVRRLVYHKELDYYVLFHNNEQDKDTGELWRSFIRKPPNLTIEFTQPGGSSPEKRVPVRLDQLTDYTAPLMR